MTAKEITKALYDFYLSSSKYCAQNIYAFKDMGEEDFLMVKNNGYLIACEVKISRSDFKADFKKDIRHQILKDGFFVTDKKIFKERLDPNKFNYSYWYPGDKVPRQRPNKFFYCCPENLIKLEEIPKYAGLIYITEYGTLKKIKEAPFLHKEKIDITEVLCQKFYYAYLELKKYKDDNGINDLQRLIRSYEKQLSL